MLCQALNGMIIWTKSRAWLVFQQLQQNLLRETAIVRGDFCYASLFCLKIFVILYCYINVKYKLGKVLTTSLLDTAGRKIHKYRNILSDNAVLHPHGESVVQRKFAFHLGC